MGLPWYYRLLPKNYVLNDIHDAFEEERSDRTSLEQRVELLERHARDLEQHIQGLEALLAEHGITPPAMDEASPLEEAPAGAPAVFPARTDETIACPRCGKRQRGNRDFCYACETPFQYENE